MPDYANSISITTESMTDWTAPEDGYIYLEWQNTPGSTSRVNIDGKPAGYVDGEGSHYGYCFAPMRKGSKITASGIYAWHTKRFYPLI